MSHLLALAAGLASPLAFAQHDPSALANKGTFIADMVGKMTLDEKIGQLRLISIGPEMPIAQLADEITAGRVGGTFNSVNRPHNRLLQDAAMKGRLKIPMFFAYDVIHGHRTTFPIGLGLASSWDMEAVKLMASTAAKEAAGDSVDMTFAPMVDIARDPRWGRTSEGFGEDPYLVSEIAKATVTGFQGTRPVPADRIMASVKHFALYGAVEGGRDYNTVDMSPMRMYNEYLPPYRAAIDAGAGGVMVALNSINGVPATSNTWLMQDLLRKDWGFKGVSVSDHGAIVELMRHGVAKDEREAAKLAIKNGIDLSMADSVYLKELPALVQSGDVAMREIDNAVREVLGAKYDMGLFHNPYLRIGVAKDDPADLDAESRLHRAAAREVARKSMVLLENRNRTLPLAKSKTIALVGPLADAPIDMLGSWSAAGNSKNAVTLRTGLNTAVGTQGRVLYARGANITNDEGIVKYLNFLNWDTPEVTQDKRTPAAMIDEAVAAARQSDVIVAAVGEARGMSHESSSRTNLDLPQSQRDLITALKATGKPLVLVLMNGRPLALQREQQEADAILETWYTGMEGGHAIADVLFGDYNPSGKLPISFPRSVGQIPTYYNHARLGRPFTEGKPGNYTSQYFEEVTGPLYPFGYGLSYTDFALSDVVLSGATMGRGGKVEAAVTVKNMGQRAGETVVQLYIQDVAASVVRPVKELKDFRKVALQPGEEKVVRFTIDESKLKFFNAQLQHVAEPGAFNVQIGLDSQAVKQTSFELR
ncbi:beta-glucosidase BglX [Variovorax arabinosiphilus]|uniref:beta-glucosidase BglX n=1 Tax=Variovorax arabinosiphilus TaxID=3053498 RepID=UPI002576960E|nr:MULTISPECIES: beta-glucosidase BglX [unclassified Variovorax]MDM0119362.1 beta-glucosidase BglX [Variovorax sp. J2L1-78]MDM0129788.1 beta-glucosidase BglX [Variovorax sp. J2L1-63]MDM0232426.1 beta-glucosidase BglX [Variovorax sp. J2R1-6]